MTDTNVKSKWVLHSIEYSGLGDKPYFIFRNTEGKVKMLPVDRGVTDLRELLNLEEE